MLIEITWPLRGLQFAVEKIVAALYKNLTFEDNLHCATIEVITPDVAETTFEIAHNLGRTPRRWLANPLSNATVWSVDKTAWNDRVIYLRCSGSTVNMTVTVW